VAEPAVAEADGAGWRGIERLGALVGAYCWTEELIFAVTGSWATGPGEAANDAAAETRVWCAAASRRHGELAARWAGRLPVRAGVDASALVVAPPGPLANAFAELVAEPDALVGVGALVEAVLPGLDSVYAAHLESASPVSEASVMEVLVEARREVRAEIQGGQTLVEASPRSDERIRKIRKFFERAFADTRVFPAVRPS
jgi:hypothetical protein